MRSCLTFIFLLISYGAWAQTQQQQKRIINTISDSRIPKELKDKLTGLNTPEELEKFKYTSTINEMSKDTSMPGMTIRTVRNISFKEGQIVGEIKSTKSHIGYTNETETIYVELCIMYCCKDKNGQEKCTQDYKLYKEWMKHPENCLNSRTTVCK